MATAFFGPPCIRCVHAGCGAVGHMMVIFTAAWRGTATHWIWTNLKAIVGIVLRPGPATGVASYVSRRPPTPLDFQEFIFFQFTLELRNARSLTATLCSYLSRSANLLTGLYILLALISSFFLFFTMSKAISISTGPIFTIFLPNGRYLREFSWSGPFFSDSSRDVAMATNLVAKMGQNYLLPAFIALSIHNGMGYRYLSGRVNSANDTSISCKNFVNFGPVTLEKTGLICILFTTWQKLAYLVKYLRI